MNQSWLAVIVTTGVLAGCGGGDDGGDGRGPSLSLDVVRGSWAGVTRVHTPWVLTFAPTSYGDVPEADGYFIAESQHQNEGNPFQAVRIDGNVITLVPMSNGVVLTDQEQAYEVVDFTEDTMRWRPLTSLPGCGEGCLDLLEFRRTEVCGIETMWMGTSNRVYDSAISADGTAHFLVGPSELEGGTGGSHIAIPPDRCQILQFEDGTELTGNAMAIGRDGAIYTIDHREGEARISKAEAGYWQRDRLAPQHQNLLPLVALGHANPYVSIGELPNGEILAMAGAHSWQGPFGGALRYELIQELVSNPPTVSGMRQLPDGRLVVAERIVFDGTTHQPYTPPVMTNAYEWSRDGGLIYASADNTYTTSVYRATSSGTDARKVATVYGAPVGISENADGTIVVGTIYDGLNIRGSLVLNEVAPNGDLWKASYSDTLEYSAYDANERVSLTMRAGGPHGGVVLGGSGAYFWRTATQGASPRNRPVNVTFTTETQVALEFPAYGESCVGPAPCAVAFPNEMLVQARVRRSDDTCEIRTVFSDGAIPATSTTDGVIDTKVGRSTTLGTPVELTVTSTVRRIAPIIIADARKALGAARGADGTLLVLRDNPIALTRIGPDGSEGATTVLTGYTAASGVQGGSIRALASGGYVLALYRATGQALVFLSPTLEVVRTVPVPDGAFVAIGADGGTTLTPGRPTVMVHHTRDASAPPVTSAVDLFSPTAMESDAVGIVVQENSGPLVALGHDGALLWPAPPLPPLVAWRLSGGAVIVNYEIMEGFAYIPQLLRIDRVTGSQGMVIQAGETASLVPYTPTFVEANGEVTMVSSSTGLLTLASTKWVPGASSTVAVSAIAAGTGNCQVTSCRGLPSFAVPMDDGRVFAAWTQTSELFLCEQPLTVATGTGGVAIGIFDPHP